jgi:predicted alpha/beta hydrolase family esterase
MADGSPNSQVWRRQEPLILIIPGAPNEDANHWQTRWQNKRPGCERVDLGMWDGPHRNTWVNKLNLAIRRAERPVLLVAHGLSCLAVAWWAEYEQPVPGDPVIGALLVAPPDVDRPGRDPRVARLGACSRGPLPFSSFLVASHDDPWCNYRTARALANDWGSRFADAGAVGHIGADAALGDWPFGERLLEQLLIEHRLAFGTGGAQRAASAPSHRALPPISSHAARA